MPNMLPLSTKIAFQLLSFGREWSTY